MNPFVRFLALLTGLILLVAPSFILFTFAYGVGKPPSIHEMPFYLSLPLLVGVFLGGGLTLAGIPKLVVGSKRLGICLFTGTLLVASAFILGTVGFEGSVTRIASPVIMLMEALVFYFLVWPAKSFATPP